MNATPHKKTSVVIVVDSKTGTEYNGLKKWLEQSNLIAYEADDVIDAIDELTDFTSGYFPNVLLVPVNSLSRDLQAVEELMHAATDPDLDFPVLPFSGRGEDPNCISSLSQLDSRLSEHFLPLSPGTSMSASVQ